MSDEINASVSQSDKSAEDTKAAELLLKYSHSFFGSYSHTVDNKGRLVIPQSFRENLGTNFCIVPSFDFSSVAIYPGTLWVTKRESYADYGDKNAYLNFYLEQVDALCYMGQEYDSQGRILLPAEIREQILKNEHDVKITGANDHIRVAAASGEKQRWESFMNALPNILDVIGKLEPKE